jgi:phosphonate transport system permease protein
MRLQTVRELRRRRPRNRFLRVSAGVALGLAVVAWLTGGFHISDVLSSRRLANLGRFLREATPQPLRDMDPSTTLATWSAPLLADVGIAASLTTLAISVAAIVLAACWALLLVLPAARNVSTPEPFVPEGSRPSRSRRAVWRALSFVTRSLLLFLRAIPDYIWAFLFVALFGPRAWPAVLALALHNTGILGRLGAEAVENTEPGRAAALRGAGATRLQVASIAIAPAAFSRFLLYFFYRWETCVRDATVLGLLGFSSLGYWIVDARARNSYDLMLFFVLLGALLVLVGDVASALCRRQVRRAT